MALWSDTTESESSDSDSIVPLASSDMSHQGVSAGNEPERSRTALDHIDKSQRFSPQLSTEVDNLSETTVNTQNTATPTTPTCSTDKVDSCDKQGTAQSIPDENVPSETNRPDWQEDKQVQAFCSFKDLEKHIDKLKLKRVMIRDLKDQCDLENGYIGGWVLVQQAFPYSQGHNVDVYIRDESTSDLNKDAKYLVVTIDGQIVEEMPTLLSEDFKLFLYKPRVEDENVEFSQDHTKRLVVEGPEPRVWIIHKHAKTKNFFQQKTCKRKWFKRQKRIIARREKEAKMRRDKLAETTENGTNDLVADSSVNEAETERSHHNQTLKQALPQGTFPKDITTHPTASSEVNDFSLPDNFSFPDSAFTKELSFDSRNETTDTSSASSSDFGTSSSSTDSDMEWRPKRVKRGKTGRNYVYKKLVDLEHGDKKVNVFGVVKEFTPPVQSRGSDLCSVVTLIDESDPFVGVKCINFNRSEGKLPQVRRIGDVLSLHRVNVEEYRLVTQVTASCYSSSQRFSGKVGKSFQVHTGCLSYTFTNADRERVKELRLWYLKRNRNMLCRKLEAVTPNTPFDLICQVVSVIQEEEDDSMILTVWDGTVCSLSTQKNPTKKDDLVLSKHSPVFNALSCGFKQQIVIHDKTLHRYVAKLEPGDVTLLHTVNAANHGVDCFELNMTACTSVSHPNDSTFSDSNVIEMLQENDYSFDNLKQQLITATASQECVSITSNKDIPLLTLSEIEDYEAIPMKCCCNVKVLGVSTPSLEETVQLRCCFCDLFTPIQQDMDISEHGVSNSPCPVCVECGQYLSESPNPYCMFLLKLKVTDMSGALVTLHVAKEEAERLLNGTSPTSYYQHQKARYQVMEKLFNLTGDNPPFNCGVTEKPRPWIKCCILKLKHRTTVYYFMFDTELCMTSS